MTSEKERMALEEAWHAGASFSRDQGLAAKETLPTEKT